MLFKSAGSGAFFRALATAPPEGGGLQPPTRRDNLIGADRRRSLRAAENRKIDAKERIDKIA